MKAASDLAKATAALVLAFAIGAAIVVGVGGTEAYRQAELVRSAWLLRLYDNVAIMLCLFATALVARALRLGTRATALAAASTCIGYLAPGALGFWMYGAILTPLYFSSVLSDFPYVGVTVSLAAWLLVHRRGPL